MSRAARSGSRCIGVLDAILRIGQTVETRMGHDRFRRICSQTTSFRQRPVADGDLPVRFHSAMSRMLVLLCLCSSCLVLTGSCHKDTTPSPIPSFCAAEPEWGPGNLIAFVNAPGYVVPPETPWPDDTLPGGLWVMKSDGTGLKSLAGTTPDSVPFYGWSPKWSPDGRWIWARDNKGRIWKVTPDGESLVLLHQGVGGPFSISPDGRGLAALTTSG